MKQYFSYILMLLFVSNLSVADGTKQLRKTVNEKTCIQIYDQEENVGPVRKFASYNASSDQRLYFTIADYTKEVVMFGFQLNIYSDTIYFRIKDPLGKVVFSPRRVPPSGQGFIQTYAEAVIGPNDPTYCPQPGGYNPFLFTPTSNGNYYVEFNWGDPDSVLTDSLEGKKHYFELFDISVINSTSKKAVEGRVWSKAWDFNTQAPENVFTAKLFIYADDGIVTSVDFNGMKPYGFIVSSNPTGTRKTGNFVNDRQSVYGDSTYPQYKIFLTYPDPVAFTPGVLGTIIDVPPIKCNSSFYCVTVTTTGAGSVETLLELNGIAGYQPGTEDILLDTTVAGAGSFCIPWDGKNGLGAMMPPQKHFQAIVTFTKGLTHLPLYDVEGNPNGYIVNLVSPVKKQLKLFWDDTKITNGIQNMSGCTPDTTNHFGCHGWATDSMEVTKALPPIDSVYFGNKVTINTWWYATLQTDTIDLFIPAPFTIGINSDHGTTKDSALLCPNASVKIYPLVSDTSDATYSYNWSMAGGKFISSSQNLIFTDVKDNTHLMLTATNLQTGCVATSDYHFTVKEIMIPNLVTPNGDDKNETFEIVNLFPYTFVSITNRWGDRVFESSNYKNEWGSSAHEGVYYYLVDTKEKCGVFKGWVEVIR